MSTIILLPFEELREDTVKEGDDLLFVYDPCQ